MTAEYPKPRWSALYRKHFPQNTDPCSRHAKCIAENLRDKTHPLYAAAQDYDDPEHIASSIEITVIALWEARAALRKAGYEWGENGKWMKQ